MTVANRRDFCKSGAAVVVASLATEAAADERGADPSGGTPIMRLFRQWEQARAEAQVTTEEACERAVDRMMELEDQMLALPSQCPADVAAKVASYTSWGDFDLPGRESRLWTDLRGLVA